jgi:DNA-binding MarR family transcriptional regulator
MTPARFDLLYLVRQVGLVGRPYLDPLVGGRSQKAIVRILGVSRQTVSKMLNRLEQLGWVARTRALDDRRTRNVVLTKEGLRRIWRAMRRVFRGRIVMKAYEDMFRPPAREPDRHVLCEIDQVWSTIDYIARTFGDTSSLSYDFGHEIDH